MRVSQAPKDEEHPLRQGRVQDSGSPLSVAAAAVPRGVPLGFIVLQVPTAVISLKAPWQLWPWAEPLSVLISVSTHPWKFRLARLQILRRQRLCCLLYQMSPLLALLVLHLTACPQHRFWRRWEDTAQADGASALARAPLPWPLHTLSLSHPHFLSSPSGI